MLCCCHHVPKIRQHHFRGFVLCQLHRLAPNTRSSSWLSLVMHCKSYGNDGHLRLWHPPPRMYASPLCAYIIFSPFCRKENPTVNTFKRGPKPTISDDLVMAFVDEQQAVCATPYKKEVFDFVRDSGKTPSEAWWRGWKHRLRKILSGRLPAFMESDRANAKLTTAEWENFFSDHVYPAVDHPFGHPSFPSTLWFPLNMSNHPLPPPPPKSLLPPPFPISTVSNGHPASLWKV